MDTQWEGDDVCLLLSKDQVPPALNLQRRNINAGECIEEIAVRGVNVDTPVLKGCMGMSEEARSSFSNSWIAALQSPAQVVATFAYSRFMLGAEQNQDSK